MGIGLTKINHVKQRHTEFVDPEESWSVSVGHRPRITVLSARSRARGEVGPHRTCLVGLHAQERRDGRIPPDEADHCVVRIGDVDARAEAGELPNAAVRDTEPIAPRSNVVQHSLRRSTQSEHIKTSGLEPSGTDGFVPERDLKSSVAVEQRCPADLGPRGEAAGSR